MVMIKESIIICVKCLARYQSMNYTCYILLLAWQNSFLFDLKPDTFCEFFGFIRLKMKTFDTLFFPPQNVRPHRAGK